MILDEFQTRHKNLADKINETYKIGNIMLDYLEKQIIIDYHLRGEQAELEKEHPEVAEKAKKYLGFEFYYELSGNNKPLPPDSEHFKTIMAKAEDLNKKFHTDMELHNKQARELKA